MGSEAAASERGNDGVLECWMTKALPHGQRGTCFFSRTRLMFLISSWLGAGRVWLEFVSTLRAKCLRLALLIGSFRGNVWFC